MSESGELTNRILGPEDIDSNLMYEHYTKQGIKFMSLALIFYSLNVLFGFIILFILISTNMGLGFSLVGWGSVLVPSFLGLFIGLISIILMIISVINFRKGRFGFSDEHKSNVNYATVFIFTFLILFFIPIFILPVFSFFLPVYAFIHVSGIWEGLALFRSFMFGFAVLILVKSFAPKKEKNMLYLFSMAMVLIPALNLLFAIILMTFFAYPGWTFGLYYNLIFSFSYSAAVLIAYFAYSGIHKAFNINNISPPPETTSKIEKPRGIVQYSQRFFAKPVMASVIIIVISIILTTALASSLYLPGAGEDNSEEGVPYFDYLSITRLTEGSGTLIEGSSTTIDIPINGELIFFYVRLTWEDEPDEQYYYNQPDCFSIAVDFGNITESTTGENPTEEKGLISIELNLNGTETYHVGIGKMTITLDYCGDHTGYWGFLPQPFAKEDNSNDYYYYIKWTILNE